MTFYIKANLDSNDGLVAPSLPPQPPITRCCWIYSADMCAISMMSQCMGKRPGGKPAIKIFIFAPKEAYDLIAQDEVANNSGCFAGLHLFSTPSKYLPGGERGQMGAGSTGGGGGGTGNSDGSSSSNGGGGGALPKFKVAVLEAGGRPLLSPPNVPHMVRICILAITQSLCLASFLFLFVPFFPEGLGGELKTQRGGVFLLLKFKCILHT